MLTPASIYIPYPSTSALANLPQDVSAVITVYQAVDPSQVNPPFHYLWIGSEQTYVAGSTSPVLSSLFQCNQSATSSNLPGCSVFFQSENADGSTQWGANLFVPANTFAAGTVGVIQLRVDVPLSNNGSVSSSNQIAMWFSQAPHSGSVIVEPPNGVASVTE